MMIDTLEYTSTEDTLYVVVENDSIVDCFAEIEPIDNPYKDFKFVTEKHDEYNGPLVREVSFVSAGWNFIVLFAVIIMLVMTKFLSPNRFGAILSTPFQTGSGDKIIRESYSCFNMVSLLMVSSYALLLSMIVQKFFLIYGGNYILHADLNFFKNILVAVILLIILNYLLTTLYSWLFDSQSLLLLHVNMHISAMASCNVVLIPLLMILLFYPYKFLLIISLIVVLLFFMIRIVIYFIEIRMLSKLSFVNIFLYLCTIEILPLMVIAKMIFLII